MQNRKVIRHRGKVKWALFGGEGHSSISSLTGSPGRLGGHVDELVDLGLGHLGLGEGREELEDDLEVSVQHGVPLWGRLEVDSGKTELLLLQGLQDVVGDDAWRTIFRQCSVSRFAG